MTGKTLLHRLQYWGYSNEFLRTVWRGLVPARLRKRIAKIAADKDYKARLLALTKIVIADIEAGIIDCDKAPDVLRFLKTNRAGIQSADFIKLWFEAGPPGRFNFNGVFLPDLTGDARMMDEFSLMFADIFLIHVLYNGNYDKNIVAKLEKNMPDGPYGYTDGQFDVTVKAGDTVIDAGAFIGDFSAYSAAKGAVAYAFEPSGSIFQTLVETSKLYENRIIPVQKGLSDSDGEVELFSDFGGGDGADTIMSHFNDTSASISMGKISVTALDSFARERKLQRVDFIKADIEGAERKLLAGAKDVLKEFAPKLSLCTYHLPDDPQVLESLITDANPRYKVRQGPNKLYACVV
jgi:FkbM family methyltransferase